MGCNISRESLLKGLSWEQAGNNKNIVGIELEYEAPTTFLGFPVWVGDIEICIA